MEESVGGPEEGVQGVSAARKPRTRCHGNHLDRQFSALCSLLSALFSLHSGIQVIDPSKQAH
jgi:hypothetical protein